jgi:hypothetical protein
VASQVRFLVKDRICWPPRSSSTSYQDFQRLLTHESRLFSPVEVIDLPPGQQKSSFHKYLEQPSAAPAKERPPALQAASPDEKKGRGPQQPQAQPQAQPQQPTGSSASPAKHQEEKRAPPAHEEDAAEQDEVEEEEAGGQQHAQAQEAHDEENAEADQEEEAAEGGDEEEADGEAAPRTVEEFLKQFARETPFYNPHFPNTNQTKHCWSAYINYQQCTKLKVQ